MIVEKPFGKNGARSDRHGFGGVDRMGLIFKINSADVVHLEAMQFVFCCVLVLLVVFIQPAGAGP